MTYREMLAQLVELGICIPNTRELKSPSPIKKECSMHDMNVFYVIKIIETRIKHKNIE